MGKRSSKPRNTQLEQHTVTDDRKKNTQKTRDLSLLFLACVIQINDAPRSMKAVAISYPTSLNEGWRTAKPGSEHAVES